MMPEAGAVSGGCSHIAFCLPALTGGGMEQVTPLLLERFAALGHRVDLVVEKRQGV